MKRAFIICFLLFPFLLFADEVRVEALEFWQNASEWPDELRVDQLVQSSLVASGIEEDLLPSYSERLNSILEEYRRDFLPLQSGLNERELGEAILHWMHETLLTGRYITDQTRIDVLLDRGDYNCVSSAVIYLILTRAAGLETAGEETTDHAFCTLALPGESVDIETTTLLGFDPGTKKEFSQSFSGQTGFAYVEPGDYRRRKPASDKKMISLILQNRIALYQRRGQYGEAVGPAVDRWFFLPNETNRNDMNDAFRNRVSLLNGRGRYTEAIDFLLPLSEELGLIEENRDLIGVLVLNQLISLLNQNLTDEGEAYLAEWGSWLSPDQIKEQKKVINERRAQTAVDRESYPEALATIRTMKGEGTLSVARSDELITWLHQNRAIEILNGGGANREESHLEVIDFFDSLPAEERDLRGITDHRARYLNNWAVLIHNRFADLVNGQKYDEAEALLNEALERGGTIKMLLDDRALLQRIRSR
ncbi:MAG: hypothetical protein PQJ59_10480 [Spirochaetales bacterium]|nr:hypothetical protein [Spirochaetales bacterium]